MEEIGNVLCLEEVAKTSEGSIPLSETTKPFIDPTLAWDNINRLEKTLNGGGISHRVSRI